MRLLITTQKVDRKDDNLGFFHDWILEFSKQCEQVTVICLWKGEYDFPKNVKVLSLGKEKWKMENGKWKIIGKLKYFFRFYYLIFKYRKDYDSVFVHMNQIYVVLGGVLWRLWNKKIALWFTHKSVNTSLRIAEKLTHKIFTASKESFRLNSKKVQVLGHGIDVNKFKVESEKFKVESEKFKVLTVGRISPSKDYDTLIDAVEKVRISGVIGDLEVRIIGGPGLKEQEEYFESLKIKVVEKRLDSVIFFAGPIAADKIKDSYGRADLFVHMSQTGSLDKAVLEAMASGLPVVSCNDAVVNDVFGEYKDELAYTQKSSDELCDRIKYVYNLEEESRSNIARDLRIIVKNDHSLDALVKKIINNINE